MLYIKAHLNKNKTFEMLKYDHHQQQTLPPKSKPGLIKDHLSLGFILHACWQEQLSWGIFTFFFGCKMNLYRPNVG